MLSKLVFKNTVLFSVLLILSCGSSAKKIEKRESNIEHTNENNIQPAKIFSGADNYTYYLPLLKNKKVGIVTNQTGILSVKYHLVDFLFDC